MTLPMALFARLKVIILLCNQKWTNQGVNQFFFFISEAGAGPFAANHHLIGVFALTKTFFTSYRFVCNECRARKRSALWVKLNVK